MKACAMRSPFARSARRCSRAGSLAVECALLLAVLGGATYLIADQAGWFAPPVLAGAGGDNNNPNSYCPVCEAPWARFARTWQMPVLVVFLASGGGMLVALWQARMGRRVSGPPPIAPAASELIAKRQDVLHRIQTQLPAVLHGGLEVQHLMSSHLAVVPPLTKASQLARIMQREHVRHLLVCHEQGRLLGIISDRDLAKRKGSTAADIMTPRPHTVPPVAPATQAINTMLGAQISCLPVVRDDRAVGILTTTDCMIALQCLMQTVSRSAEELLAAAE